jgi:hypothetical protein
LFDLKACFFVPTHASLRPAPAGEGWPRLAHNDTDSVAIANTTDLLLDEFKARALLVRDWFKDLNPYGEDTAEQLRHETEPVAAVNARWLQKLREFLSLVGVKASWRSCWASLGHISGEC